MLTPRSLLRLATPPYLFQPLQVFRRLRLEYFWRSRTEALITLPWGLPLMINPHEAVGYNIASQGLYALGVSETLYRLTAPGDLAIDAGANIGHMSSILAVRVGPRGQVICFEPNPSVFESLRENVDRWKTDPRCGSFDLQQAALGKESGTAQLLMSDWFDTNRGTSFLSDPARNSQYQGLRSIDVPVRTLDESLDPHASVGILKIDVQGHELSVLQGASQLLKRHAIRDILFEEESPHYPAPTHDYLQSLGYSIFGIAESFTGVHLVPNSQPHSQLDQAPTTNFLATADPARALRLLKPPLWRSFGLARLLSR